MSKGNAVVPVRFPPELLAEIEEAVQRSERTRAAEPWTVSEFIRTAVREKLDKMRRSRAARPKK